MKRRDFLKFAALAGGSLMFRDTTQAIQQNPKTVVSLVKSDDRRQAVHKAIELLDINPVKGKNVVIKPNFNSADQFPGSTHNDTLKLFIEQMSQMGARSFLVADRSGMGNTREIMRQKGIFDMANEMGFETVVLDELPEAAWKHFDLEETHWQKGLYLPKPFLEAESLVQTCCLKTHQFGGHFTISLKNSVGMVAKLSPADNYNFMNELHSSPHQRLMIAEINLLYKPDLILLDGMEAFVEGGPATGKLARPGVMIAGTDRVAVDAVGVAILRLMGTPPPVSSGTIFDQEQIKRATELEIGIGSPEQIEVVVDNDESLAFAQKLTPLLGMSIRAASVNPQGKWYMLWGAIKGIEASGSDW